MNTINKDNQPIIKTENHRHTRDIPNYKMDEKNIGKSELLKIKSYRVPLCKIGVDSFPFVLPKFWLRVANVEAGDILEVYMERGTFDLKICLIKGKRNLLTVSSANKTPIAVNSSSE